MTGSNAERATSSTTSDAVAGQCADLLAGIELSPEIHASALAIVTADAAARRELVVHHPHRFWDQIAMIAARDAAVRDLLTTDAQRSGFDVNVAKWNSIRRGGAGQ